MNPAVSHVTSSLPCMQKKKMSYRKGWDHEKEQRELAVIVFLTWNMKDNSRKMTVHLSSRSLKKEWVKFE